MTQVGIKSLKGNLCRLQNPWPGKKNIVIHEKSGNDKVVKFRMKENDVIVFPTKPAMEYTVMMDGERMNERTIYSGTPNMKVKSLENRVLGKSVDGMILNLIAQKNEKICTEYHCNV